MSTTITATVAFDGTQPVRPVGHFTFVVDEDRWTWGEGLYAMHGYAPREVPATTEVLLSHKHPDDRTRALEVLEGAMHDGLPFSCYHRIIDSTERVRSVLSVGHGIQDADGRVTIVEGFFVDLTDVRRDETQAEVAEALRRIAEHRETIDLAKGMLMLAGGCDADTAFRVLRRCSQNANVKLHEVADRLVQAARTGALAGEQVTEFLEGLVSEAKGAPTGASR